LYPSTRNSQEFLFGGYKKAFELNIDKDIVRRVFEKHYHPGTDSGNGPSWLTFIGHLKDSLWSIDLFRCESILLNTHWVLVVTDQFTRRIIGFGVHAGDIPSEIYGETIIRRANLTRFHGVFAPNSDTGEAGHGRSACHDRGCG